MATSSRAASISKSRHLLAVIERYKLPADWHPGKYRTINEKGYIKIKGADHHPDRNKYEHRVVMREAIREWNPFGWTDVPEGFTVHHIDSVTVHNCRQNLCLLQTEIHDVLKRSHDDYRCPYTGKYLNHDQYRAIVGYTDNEVPF